MGYYHLNGIVLQNEDISEQDVVVTALTRERGKVRFIVKGTKKPESTLRPAIEPLTEGHFFLAERRALDLLSEWEPICYNFEIKNNISKVPITGFILRCLIELTLENITDMQLYNILKNIIKLLHIYSEYDIIKTIFEWGLLKVSGLAPDFGVCADCGRTAGARYFIWDIGEGAFFCGSCADVRGPRNISLCLGDVEFGKRIITVSEFLCRRTLENAGEAMKFTEIISYNARRESSFLAKISQAVTLFCEYHLREGLRDWYVRI